jgi:RHH-type transcriptional regulator, proline utilization regulon repressor / proline dehydrogenase / delta 1-pyrroline-5-carboxylate dehydrogenase
VKAPPIRSDYGSKNCGNLSSSTVISRLNLNKEWDLWRASVESYAFYWNSTFSKDHDPSGVLGQDNILRYIPYGQMTLRIQEKDSPVDVLRVIAAALTTGTMLEVSNSDSRYEWVEKLPTIIVIHETEQKLIDRISDQKIERIRLLNKPSTDLEMALAETGCRVHLDPVMANGRIELLHYLREVSISRDYHRYGNVGFHEPLCRK